MPWQVILRRRRVWSRSYGPTPPVGPHPPLDHLVARYLGSAINGFEGGVPRPQPAQGPISQWESSWGTAHPLVSVGSVDPEYELVDDEGDGLHIVWLDLDAVMESAFQAPTGANPRTIFFVGAVGEDTDPGSRLFGYGTPSDDGAFDLCVAAGGDLGWRFSGAIVGSGIEIGDAPTGVLMQYEQPDFRLGVVHGPDPVTATADLATTTGPLTVGSPDAQVSVLELLVYDRALTDEEIGEVFEYLDAAYPLDPGGDIPEAGLIGRWRATDVNGEGNPLPDDSATITSWLPLVGAESMEQAVAENSPTFLRLPVNGRPRLRFDSGDSLNAALAMPVGSAARTIVLVGVNWTATPGQQLLAAGSGGVEHGAFSLVTAEGDGDFGWLADADTTVSSDFPTDAGLHVLQLSKGDDANVRLHVDGGTPTVTVIVLDTQQAGLTVGGATSRFDAYEVLAYDRGLSEAEAGRIATYVGDNYQPSPQPSFPSDSLLADWRASAVNGIDPGGFVIAPGPTRSLEAWHGFAEDDALELVQPVALSRPVFFNDSTSAFVRCGMGQSLASPDVALLPTGARTVILVVTNLTAAPDQRFVQYGDMTTDGAGFAIGTDGAGNLAWFGGGAVTGAFHPAGQLTGGPHVLFFRYNGATVRASVDGTMAVPPEPAALTTDVSSGVLRVGAEAGTAVDVMQMTVYSADIADQAWSEYYGYAQSTYGIDMGP